MNRQLQTVNATAPAAFSETAQTLAAMDFKAIVENATPAQLEQMARLYMAQQAQATFTAAVKIAGIDYSAEKNTFLDNAGRTKSRHTARAYRNALNELDAYAAESRLNVLEMTPAAADGFIYWINHKGKSAATVRLAAAAASSFFTFLERRNPGTITNVFRGTKARPAQSYSRVDLPTAADIDALVKALPAKWAAAVSIMAGRGLRVGGLSGFSIKGSRFTTRTKGQDKSGDLDAGIVETVKAAGLELRQPFGDMTGEQLQHVITYEIGKAYRAGKVRFPFSPHKLRHFYAVSEYRRTKDIRRVSKLLGHSGIVVTERYLRGLGEID
jgi:site-specific recombinase XerD